MAPPGRGLRGRSSRAKSARIPAPMSEPSAQEHAPRRGLLKNPFLWAFVIGIVTLTLLRPLLIHRPDPPPVGWQLPEFTLTDQLGEPFGSRDLAGDVYVASFFFTSCPTICPRLMEQVKKLQWGFDEYDVEDVRLISISVDPETDTPERLAAYAEGLGVDPARWRLLTGDRAEIRRLLEQGFKVAMGQRSEDDAMFDIAHSAKLVLVDPQGGHRGYYDTDDEGLDEVFHRSQHVLREARQR